jgi:hypothetical protein
VSGQFAAPATLTLGKELPHTQWKGGWVGPNTSLCTVEKRKFLTLLILKLQALSCPDHNKLLYQLCYPGSSQESNNKKKKRRRKKQYIQNEMFKKDTKHFYSHFGAKTTGLKTTHIWKKLSFRKSLLEQKHYDKDLELEFVLWLTVSRPARPGIGLSFGPMTRFYLSRFFFV